MDRKEKNEQKNTLDELEQLKSVADLAPLAKDNEKIQKKFFTRRDIFMFFGLVAFIAALFLGRALLAKKGTVAVVTVVDGETQEVDLSKDQTLHIDAKLPVTLEVSGGQIRFINSVCPDHLCEGFGFISHEGEQATCMPAGVNVTVREK